MPSLPSSLTSANAEGPTDPGSYRREILWDVSECLQRLDCETDPEILRDVISAFVEDSGRRLKELRQAAQAGQTAELRTQVHSLKGSSNQMSAKRMAALCRHIEQRCRERSSNEIVTLLDELGRVLLLTSQSMLAHVDVP